jgi:hypothetical protein
MMLPGMFLGRGSRSVAPGTDEQFADFAFRLRLDFSRAPMEQCVVVRVAVSTVSHLVMRIDSFQSASCAPTFAS